MSAWGWLGAAPLTSAHSKSGPSTMPAAALVIGTWALLGLAVAFAVMWVFLWRRQPQKSNRPWWGWTCWGLVLVASVEGALWAARFLGNGSLGWAVPTLAGIVVPLFVIWYQQTGTKEIAAAGEPVADRRLPDTPAQRTVPWESVTPPTPLVPSGLVEGADIDRDVLDEARGVLADLHSGIAALHVRIEAAVQAGQPGADWRILLGMPRRQLQACTELLEQLNQLPQRWVHAVQWSFAFADTLAEANGASAELRRAMEDKASGWSPRTDLSEGATRLSELAGRLDSLVESAVLPP